MVNRFLFGWVLLTVSSSWQMTQNGLHNTQWEKYYALVGFRWQIICIAKSSSQLKGTADTGMGRDGVSGPLLDGPVIRSMLFVHALLSARSVYGNIIREQQFIIIQRWWPFGFFFRFFAILLVGVSHCLLPKTTRWHRPKTRVFANEWVKVWRTIRTNGKRW